MRVNVYAEEMTDRVEVISKTTEDGEFTGLRIYLELPCTMPSNGPDGEPTANVVNVRGPFIHRPGDDDSAAVTFWGKKDLRAVLLKAVAALDAHYRANPSKDFGDDGRGKRCRHGHPIGGNRVCTPCSLDDGKEVA